MKNNSKFLTSTFCLMFCVLLYAANPKSPMAKLMRAMHTYLENEKQNISRQLPIQKISINRNQIYTARLSPGKNFFPRHRELSDTLLHEIDAYEQGGESLRKINFNNIVSSCVACHQQVCPGPLEMIQKLYINE